MCLAVISDMAKRDRLHGQQDLATSRALLAQCVTAEVKNGGLDMENCLNSHHWF